MHAPIPYILHPRLHAGVHLTATEQCNICPQTTMMKVEIKYFWPTAILPTIFLIMSLIHALFSLNAKLATNISFHQNIINVLLN